MILRIMTWNIKGEASLGWNNKYEIKKDLVDKIILQEADIIVLTAFVTAKGLDYLFEILKANGYIWFEQNRTGKNGVLIAIKKEFVNTQELIDNIYNKEIIYSNFSDCNILNVIVPLKNELYLSIIGCRMEIGGCKTLRQQYDLERKCFDELLLPLIKQKTTNYPLGIICGDFNNAQCRGTLAEPFNEEDYMDYDQINYNLNIIKDKFENIGLKMADIKENGEVIPTHFKENHYGRIYEYPLDHIFLKGMSSQKCYTVKVPELSDHYILISEVICD